jgi:hypothetical protein
MSFVSNSKGKWGPPLLYLIVLVLSLGLLLPNLGFYWDDWPPILIGNMQGIQNYWDFYQYDRPFSAWTYVILYPVLGKTPLPWHIFSLGIRWLTTVFLWLTLCEIWPGRRKQATWAGLLFAIYPVFDQQAISVAFSQHWICYLLFACSLWAMVKAARTNNVAYALLSSVLAGVHLWTMEYFAGLELLRPVVLLFLASEAERNWKWRAAFMMKCWAPYLAIFFAFLYWRIILLELPGEDPNPLVLISMLQENPVSGIWHLLRESYKDIVYILFGVWGKTIQRSFLELDSPFFRLTGAVSFLSAAITWFYLAFIRADRNEPYHKPFMGWAYQAMAVGVIAVALGALPAWIAGREVTASFFSSRFGLASMFGAALFLVGLLEWVTPRYLVKFTLLSALVAVSTNYHIRISDLYRTSWELQRNFYWQLSWRAPYIQPDTPLISDNEVLLYAGGYATAIGINLLYGEGSQPADIAYWFFVLDDNLEGQIERFRNRKTLRENLRNLNFSGESLDSLIINYDGQRCLHMLSAERPENHLLPANLQEVVPVSNLDRILLVTNAPPPDEQIFGQEPERAWCFYYQKAELARQFRNWNEITELGDQAAAAGYTPYDPIEWFVFIEAYAMNAQTGLATQLTQDVLAARSDYAPLLCDLWGRLSQRKLNDIPGRNTQDLLPPVDLPCHND